MADTGALAGVRVLESCGWAGAFAGHLLAEAGADVIRVVPPAGDPLESEGPFFGQSGVSIQHTWYNLGKRIVRLDLETVPGRDALKGLLGGCDVLVEDWAVGDEPLGPGALAEARPGLVRLSITHGGRAAPALKTNDLVANALSGAASVTGDATTPPLTGYGNQTYHTVGFYAAICTLASLRAARLTGQSQHVDISTHEALVSCTEQLLMQWFYPGNWPRTARRQGSLHWSGAYSVYPDRDGDGFHVTAALRFIETVLPWLAEDGMAGDLADAEKYPNLIALVQSLPQVMDTLRDWVGTKESAIFFLEAQAKHLPWGPALDIPAVLQSPQIAARGFLQPRDVPGAGTFPLPGRAFRTTSDGPPPAAPRSISVVESGWDRRAPRPAVAGLPAGKPLDGVRILDFTHVLAGPFGTRVLGDLGADVLKLGTSIRSGGANNPTHPYYISWNRNKRSLMVDMGSEKGRTIARRLAQRSDAVIENFSAGVLKRWGMDRAGLAATNPKVTVVSMGGMGQTGPWKDFVTFAPTVHALVGLTYMTNPPGQNLLGYGFSLTDHLSGLGGALAILEGVEHARRTGHGLEVDLSQYELGLGIMAPGLIDQLANGTAPEPAGNRHPFRSWAPHGIYPAAGDDRWVAIACQGDGEWRTLCTVMGRPELAADPRFATHAGRLKDQDVLDEVVSGWTAAFDRYEVMARCQAAGIAAGAVQNAEDLTSVDETLRAREFFGDAEASGGSPPNPIDRFPALFNGSRPPSYRAPHQLGSDTFDILTDVLEMDDAEVAELMAEGVLT
jgi:crotonobetainyl-CoA:carnitine CoA-transferase CaiB-like acyl-CoA transferase